MSGTTSGTQGASLFECPVCLGRLSAPKVLPCGHSLCEACLEPLVQTERGQRLVKCPECREVAHVPENGFPKNYKLEEALSHLRGGEPKKTCKGCDKDFDGAEIMRCLTCEKDFCEREVAICGICALRGHKQHDILDLPTWPKDCFKVIGCGQTSLIVTNVSELSSIPKRGDKVEIPGASWHLEALIRASADREVVYWNLIYKSEDKRRYWADIVFLLEVPGTVIREEMKLRKRLFGNGMKVPSYGSTPKSKCQEMLDKGPITMTVHLTVLEDIFVQSNEHSDLKLVVEGQDIHVKRGILSAASAPLANLLDTATDAGLTFPDFGAFELLTFLLAIYPTHRSTQDLYTSLHHVTSIHKLANAYEVKWLLDDIDTHLMADVDDVSSRFRLYMAQHTQRHETVTKIIDCMTSGEIEEACAKAKSKEYGYDAATLLKLLDKYIRLKAVHSNSPLISS